MNKTNEICIEPMQEKYLPEVSKLFFEIYQYHDRILPEFFTSKTPESFIQYYQGLKDKPNVIFFVATENDTVIGYLSATIMDRPWQKRTPVCNMEEIGVISAYRHKGVGTRLVEALRQECRKRNIAYITLNVYDKNAPALQFYKKLGGQIISHRIDIKIT